MPHWGDLSHEVHLWYSPTMAFAESEFANHAASVISPEESQRAERFAFAKDRQSYIAAHSLLRRVLSHYVPIPPQAWKFALGSHGKPFVTGPVEGLSLRFNLSHTAGMVALAVTCVGEVGVDVETVKPRDHLNLARRYFAPSEISQIELLSRENQPDAFFRLWTLKEAYIKAQGMGLAMNLASFAFPNVQDENITIEFLEDKEENPNHWSFFRHEPDSNHKIAVAVRRGTNNVPRLKIFQGIPASEGFQ